MMKITAAFYILVLFMISEVRGQKTPADFGSIAFYCFQHNRLDSLFKLIPTLEELSGFAKDLGVVPGSPAYESLIKRYPLVVKSFKDKCYQIQRDSLEYKFSWANARLEKLEPVEKTIVADNVPNKKAVPMTALNIYFNSRGQSFVLKFGDLHPYNGSWKSGNNVSLSIQIK